MNSEHYRVMTAESSDQSERTGEVNAGRKRKRKRMAETTPVDPVDDQVELMFNSAILAAKSSGIFSADATLVQDNNIAARQVVESLGCGDLLFQLTTLPHHLSSQLDYITLNDQEDADSCSDPMFHSVVESKSAEPLTVCLHSRRFLLPPRSRFIMSDLEGIRSFAKSSSEKFDFLVIDPPWENKSVKRQKTYSTLSNYDLFKLPVRSLASDTAILALWCTNRKSHHEFVKQKLLPSWGFEVTSIWYWCKVTTSGEPICPFGSQGKKAYETLFITHRVGGSIVEELKKPRLLVTVPSLLHSSKPPLIEVFLNCLTAEPKCLELFARNLLPNFTSWGNEVLKHQDADYIEKSSANVVEDQINMS